AYAQSPKKFIFELLKITVIVVAVVVPIRYFLFEPVYVDGSSMEPNFHDYEYILVDKITYRFEEPQRGDVIVANIPEHDGFLIKRLIGLPGERVSISDGAVTIHNNEFPDGFVLNESYLGQGISTSGTYNIVLDNNEYFFMGDNRPVSLDGRYYGPVTIDEIEGRAWFRIWPFDRIDNFSAPEY
ncbi:signal peptidase I, partial [Patescibacteria group bacterium]